MSQESVAERLMNALISKMETMDGDLQVLKAENQKLRDAVSDPISMLRKAGFVPAATPLSQDVSTDAFRGDVGVENQMDSGLLKSQNEYSNNEIHLMSWEEIHEMAEQAKGTEVIQ
tara:strand:- start:146 stop:493 length:348 start_codon:yes stop_codon:yes gene_type:complete